MDIDLGSVERELCRIPDVRAARIVLDRDGDPAEVHVLAAPGKHAKQLVRDVQSVALATVGLQIDHRIVSVVQLDDAPAAHAPPAAPTAPEAAPTAAATSVATEAEAPAGVAVDEHAEDQQAPTPTQQPAQPHPDRPPSADPATEGVADDRIIVDGVIALRRGVSFTAEVTLRRGEQSVTGSSEGSSAASSALRLVGEATVDALRQLVPSAGHLHVETASTTRIGDHTIAIVTLVLVVPPNEEMVTGSAPVRPAGEHDAIARAVLDATNRRVAGVR